jgi:ABC-type sugar transport system permease subunit
LWRAAADRRFVGALLLGLFALGTLVPATRAAGESWRVGGDAPVYGVTASADGGLVVAGRRDNSVAAYGADGEPRWTFATQGIVYAVAVSADGQRVAAASEDRNVYLLDGDGRELWRHRGPRTFTDVAITADGAVVVAGSDDRRVTALDGGGAVLWEATTSAPVTAVAVYGGGSGHRALAGTSDSRVALLDGGGQRLWETVLDYQVEALAAVANGAQVAAGDEGGGVTLLDGARGTRLWTAATGARVGGVAIARDGSLVVAGTRGGEVVAFRGDGTEVQREDVGGEVFAVDLAADGGAAAAVGDAVAFFSQAGDGRFEIPREQSRVWRYAAVAVAAVLALLGRRRRPDGRRAWRGLASGRGDLGRRVWRARLSYLFLVPTLVLLLIFNYYPAFSGIYHAFTDWDPAGETEWVGLDQFRALGRDRYFWVGTGNLVILILAAFAKLAIPLVVAELIFHLRSAVLRYVMRTAFVLQVIVPGVVGILLWVNVYDPNIGLANQLLRGAGLDGWARSWLGDADTALWAIVFMGFPWVSAFALLIFYGGLISIPGELFDAAQLDGAGVLRRILNIDLPLLLGQVRLLVILTFIAVVQEFAAVFLTTGGGPGSATYVPSLELYYQAVRFNNFGLASAIGAVLFVVILLGTVLNLRFVKSSVEYGT